MTPTIPAKVPSSAYLIAWSIFSIFAVTYTFFAINSGSQESVWLLLSSGFFPVMACLSVPYSFVFVLLIGFLAPYLDSSRLRIGALGISPRALTFTAILIDFTLAFYLNSEFQRGWVMSFHVLASLWIFVWWGSVGLARRIGQSRKIASRPSLASELEAIAELKKRGELTDEEFSAAKAILLQTYLGE
jgi:hypothetical protein